MKRRRLTPTEELYLEEIFQDKPFIWTKLLKGELAEKLGLDETKIYKWNWERMRKQKRGTGGARKKRVKKKIFEFDPYIS
jgi:hypothetical protein